MTSQINFDCSNCGDKVLARSEWKGRCAKCPSCGKFVVVPGLFLEVPEKTEAIDDICWKESCRHENLDFSHSDGSSEAYAWASTGAMGYVSCKDCGEIFVN